MGQGFMSKIESKIQEKVMSFLFRGKELFKPLNTGHMIVSNNVRNFVS